MERKVNPIAVWAFLAILGLGLAAADAEAFCVYNHTDRDVQFYQVDGGKAFKMYSNIISPGGKGCCNWGNSDCNTSGKKDSTVKFNANYFKFFDKLWGVDICTNFSVKAGGWMTVSGKNENYKCEAHY